MRSALRTLGVWTLFLALALAACKRDVTLTIKVRTDDAGLARTSTTP